MPPRKRQPAQNGSAPQDVAPCRRVARGTTGHPASCTINLLVFREFKSQISDAKRAFRRSEMERMTG